MCNLTILIPIAKEYPAKRLPEVCLKITFLCKNAKCMRIIASSNIE